MYFTVERVKRILSELEGYIYSNRIDIDTYRVKSCSYGDYILLKESSETWEPFKKGERWGGRDRHFWFKTRVRIPQAFEGKTVVYEVATGREGQWDAINPQFLVYVNDVISQGFDVNHRRLILSENARAGEEYEIALYAYAGMQESLLELNSSIAVLEKEVEKLYYDTKVPLEIAELLPDDDKRRLDILKYITHAVNMIDLRIPGSQSFYSSVNETAEYLEREFYGRFCGGSDVTEICVGHTHIDVAWLWTLAQTREKAARSFSTVLSLMKQYPEYIFMSSQPQLYKFIKEDHPEIYEEIKKMVREGRWEPEGAMWLEADCNLTSGESLVRQIMYGKRFFKEEFGVDSKLLWLPDVFGYSAALPQIMKKSGVNYFMTTKISWNEYNRMPYDTFMWRGIDGTEVLTHFISTTDYSKDGRPSTNTTYNGSINASQVMGCWQRYQQKDINDEVLNCFGYGDGGGGATKEMLEAARRFSRGIPGAPKIKMGKALDYFEKLNKKLEGNKKLPKWVGELYLEYHRGTYTSMARNKRFNRKTEFLNQEAEMLSVLNSEVSGKDYPAEKLIECWETTLLNQFHDIIPGSSIKEVYDDSREQYERINSIAREVVDSAAAGIASEIRLEETSVVVFNQLSFERDDIAEFQIPEGWENITVYDGQILLPSQKVEDNKVIFFAKGIPAKGYKSFTIRNSDEEYGSGGLSKVNAGEMESRFFKIELDNCANLTSIYDKLNEREILKDGQRGNVIQAFEDKAHNYDAWDINIYYQEKQWEVNEVESIEVVEEGPVRSTLKIRKKFLNSTIVQKLHIYNDMPRIDFETDIDWKERQILLKAAFPVDVHADKATYEIQYGNVERPTHWNTSWDYARFEVCAHKWADISEEGYGTALLNDCKYGHDIKDSVMRLTLLKSAVNPNIDADREKHKFIYSLYPHSGDWKEGKVAQAAYKLNSPLTVKVEGPHEGTLPNLLSMFKVDKDNVIIEVVKKAEDSEDIIIRLYEYQNRRTKVQVKAFKTIGKAAECDLMENEISVLKPQKDNFSFEIKPYEIKTFKINFN
ncbi:MAG: alpha-mannosidase [Bacillota bacterium]|nr:alpha-mannosidase [Bacillota bacterium]